MLTSLTSYDTALFVFLNGLHCTLLDPLMVFISEKHVWIPLYLIILLFIIKKFRINSLYIVPAMILMIVFSDQAANIIKYAVARPRPCGAEELFLSGHFPGGLCKGAYGFYSAHASNSFSLAIFSSLLFNKRWYALFIIFWAFTVSYSRIYLGVHYPGDVLCGAIAGIVWGYIFYFSSAFIIKRYGGLSVS